MPINDSKVVAIIPSRIKSLRLPNKALIDIAGFPMIIHVLKRTLMSSMVDEVFVATDSEIIKNTVEEFGGRVLMTSSHHPTGTDRLSEAINHIQGDIFVNVQGDEALVNPNHIDTAVNILVNDSECDVGILVNAFNKHNSTSDIKVVLDNFNRVMYFSRSDIPNDSRNKNSNMLKAYHIVPFRRRILEVFPSLPSANLEYIEMNEYLRLLQNGIKIKAALVDSTAISVDTLDDLNYVVDLMPHDKYYQLYMNDAPIAQ